MTPLTARSRLALWLLSAWLLLTLWAVARIDQAVYSDPAWGMLAAEQWRLGLSPGPRTALQADPGDLRRDVTGVVSWWPPAYQGVPLLWKQLADASWGEAVRASVLLSWASALVGWALYFRQAGTRAIHWLWLVLIFATSRHTHAGFDNYDGEVLLLGAFPWVLVWNVRALAAERRQAWLAGLAGVASAALFAVKYSALLGCVALAVAWLSTCLPRPSWRACVSAASYAAGALIVVLGLRALGIPGGPTPGDAPVEALAPARALYPFAMLPLALTDLDSLVQFLFAHPTRPWLPPWDRWLLGAPLLLACAGLLVWVRRERGAPPERSRSEAAALRCAVALSCVVPEVLGVLLLQGAGVDDRARHVRLVALALLPFVVDGFAAGVRTASRKLRVAALLASAILIAVPCAYGAATLLDKAFRRARAHDSRIGAAGLRMDVLGAHADARTFERALLSARPSADTVLYITSPDLALDLVGARMIVRHADFVPASELARERFEGCPQGGVLLALPRAFEHDGKRDLIRKSFVDVARWHVHELPGDTEMLVHSGVCAQ